VKFGRALPSLSKVQDADIQSTIRCPSQDGSSRWDPVPTGKLQTGAKWQELTLAEVDTTTTPTQSSEDVTELYQSTSTFQDGESDLCITQT